MIPANLAKKAKGIESKKLMSKSVKGFSFRTFFQFISPITGNSFWVSFLKRVNLEFKVTLAHSKARFGKLAYQGK